MEQTTHTPIRARHTDGYMRLLAAAGPILSDAMPLARITRIRILPFFPSARKYISNCKTPYVCEFLHPYAFAVLFELVLSALV